MKPEFTTWIKRFALEFVLYAILVGAYYFTVLHFLGPSLQALYLRDRRTYAALALLLIAGQGLLLEILTRFLLGLLSSRGEER